MRPTRSRTTAVPWSNLGALRSIIVVTMVVSTLGVISLGPLGFELPGRVGFLLAGIGTLLAWSVAARRLRQCATRQDGLLALSLLLFWVTRALWIPMATNRAAALFQEIRTASVLAYLFLVVAARRQDPAIPRALAKGATALVAFNAALFLAGLASTTVHRVVNETGFDHEHLHDLARFQGIEGAPFPCATIMLVCAALARFLEDRRWRAVTTAGAISIAAITWSFATLTIPLALVYVAFRRWSLLRLWLVAAVAVTALLVLYVHPVSVHLGHRDFALQPVHPSYFVEGLGPEFMPMRWIGWPNLSLTYHGTGYFYLAKRAVECFLEHPLVGVGGRNFAPACPLVTMTTHGVWVENDIPHNEYLGALAECGIGIVVTGFVLMVILLRRGFNCVDDWQRGLILAYLLAAFAGEIWFQFPFAALVACVMKTGEVEPGG